MILYKNCCVFTGDGTFADCFVVDHDAFVFVGRTDEALLAYPRSRIVDLGGRFVCAGFNDSHMHLLNLGCVLTQAQLAPCTDSLAHVLAALSEYAKANPDQAWILGRGWNHDDFTDERRYPTRDDLDLVCPDKPCLITRACGHVAIANSAALRLCGIDAHAVPVDGGRIVTDDSGRPNGVLEENAMDLVTGRMPVPDRKQLKEQLLRAMAFVNRYGITSVQTDDFTSSRAPFEEVLAAYSELEAEGRLTVRVNEQCLLPDKPSLERFLTAGWMTGKGSSRFRIGPLKLITDGSLGSRTAKLLAPYSDAPDTCGIAIYDLETLRDLIVTAHCAGMQIAAHAIGDGAADNVLDAIEHAQQCMPRDDARHGIVHAQILNRRQAAHMGRLHMHAYIQSIFLDYDTQIVRSRIGNRAEEAYPAASFMGHGVTFSNGSDSPVELPDVLFGVQCAVTRKSITRSSDVAYLPDEALSVSDALLSFTANGAYASFEEHIKGRIRPGMLADFTVLEDSPFETDPSAIHQLPVFAVYVGGKQVL